MDFQAIRNHPAQQMIVLSAGEFSLERLTEAYNQTRTDYLVPMPLSPIRFREYITLYDVDLEQSTVVVGDDDQILGLGMLGMRAGKGWITRLGVLPGDRRHGIGTAIMDNLLAAAAAQGLPVVWLEVIKGNAPAQTLFLKYGFKPLRELIVARRSPRAPRASAIWAQARQVVYLDHYQALSLLAQRRERANWLNETESLRNVEKLATIGFSNELPQEGTAHISAHLSGLLIDFGRNQRGWIVYRATNIQIRQIVVEVLSGDPSFVTANLLDALHQHHRAQDAIVENIPDDAQWAGFLQAGYFEVFRRIEMIKTENHSNNSSSTFPTEHDGA